MTEQPTEQCVQMFLRVVTVAPSGAGGPPSALRTATGRLPSAARPPATRPERCRKVRRSRPPPDDEDGAVSAVARVPCPARRDIFFLSTGVSFNGPDSG